MKSIFTFVGFIVIMFMGAGVLLANGASESAYWIFGAILGIMLCSSGKKKENK